MNIASLLHERARRSGDAVAIVEPGRSISFAGLDRAAASAAAGLRDAGLRAGDRVLVLMPMSSALYATLVGIWRAGGVAVFLDPSAGLDHVGACCRLVEPRVFVGARRAHLLRVASAAVRAIPLKMAVGAWVPGAPRLDLDGRDTRDGPIAEAAPDTPALITFTSGSTGQPKAAARSHGFMIAQHRVLADDLHLSAGERDLSALPIFVLANLASGVTSIIPDADLRRPGEIMPARLLRQIRLERPTRVAASPALLDRLARHAALHRETLAAFDQIYTGGAPVFPRLLRLLHDVAPDAAVVAVYGSTEAEPIARIAWSEISPQDLRAMESGAGLLAGHPVAAIDLRVLPDRWGAPIGPYSAEELSRDALAPQTPGEIVVSGEHVLGGYLGGRGDSETKFRVDDRVWHRTGDAGYLDRAGRLWLLGRASARIDDGRGVLYPFAVETAAMAVETVRRCALVGAKGRRVLVVELEGSTQSDVVSALLARLSWAHLDEVVPVGQVPMDKRHNAKVDYPALERMLKKRS